MAYSSKQMLPFLFLSKDAYRKVYFHKDTKMKQTISLDPVINSQCKYPDGFNPNKTPQSILSIWNFAVRLFFRDNMQREGLGKYCCLQLTLKLILGIC